MPQIMTASNKANAVRKHNYSRQHNRYHGPDHKRTNQQISFSGNAKLMQPAYRKWDRDHSNPYIEEKEVANIRKMNGAMYACGEIIHMQSTNPR
ncbi:Uncharacterised protein [Mycobacteroides abscessus subsp. abscessus]|nr:Uncharacterised protein [Mycobacteroides abscessus subsp. abscessus]